MGKCKVVVTDDRYNTYAIEEEILREIDADIRIYPMLDKEEALEALADADGVLLNLFNLDGDIIDNMNRCRIISRYGVGYDNVDVNAAAKRGIWVSNVPEYASESVSDHALALMLSCMRGIFVKDKLVRSGEWDIKAKKPIHTMKGSVLGIVGYGSSGSAFHRKVGSLGFSRVLVYDPYIPKERIIASGGAVASFEDLITQADCISVHALLSEETKYMFTFDVFMKMKPHAVLVNTARGPIVREEDLIRALETGEIGCAGLDVFEREPLPAVSPLKNLDNVILTDHAGWYTEESLRELKTTAARNILETFQNGKPVYPVNKAAYA